MHMIHMQTERCTIDIWDNDDCFGAAALRQGEVGVMPSQLHLLPLWLSFPECCRLHWAVRFNATNHLVKADIRHDDETLAA